MQNGVVSWRLLTGDQYNKNEATGTPNNATLYVNLIDNSGNWIHGGQRIVIHPAQNHCGHRGYQSWQGTVSGYPSNLTIADIKDVILTDEFVTYTTRSC
jgi:hypothetical protein